MSSKRHSLRAAIALFTIVIISAAASAASWTDIVNLIPFIAANTAGTPNIVHADDSQKAATIGSCDTAGPIEVESTGGTTAPTAYTTLGAAMAAVNVGTHTGSINIEVCGSTNEGATSATLNGSGQGAANYSAIMIRPLLDNLSISGNPSTGFGVIQLKGADNITIDGDNPNSGGIDRNLTINSTNTPTAIAGSVIRIATVGTVAASADNNTFRNLILNGNVTGGNASGITSTASSSNSSFGIFVGGNGGTTATDAPTAITSVSSQPLPANTTVNNLTIDNNAISQTARAIAFVGNNTNQSTAVTITGNDIGNPSAGNPTGVYSMGLTVQGTSALLVRRNSFYIESYLGAAIRAIDIGSISPNIAGVVIEANKVIRVRNNNPGAFGAYGINLGGGNNSTVQNNFVGEVRNDQTAGTGSFTVVNGAFGIRSAAGTGHKIYHNTVHMVGNVPGVVNKLLTAAFALTGTSQTGLDVRNNIFSNQLTGGNPAPASTRHACVYLPSGGTGTLNLTWNNNNYFQGPNTTGALSLLAQVGTITPGTGEYFVADFDPTTTNPATNFRAYTSILSGSGLNDNSSRTDDPIFISDTDLHLQPTSPVIGLGVTVNVTDDIDGDLRPVTPAIGADEITSSTAPTGVGLATPSSVVQGGNSVLTVTVTPGTNPASTGISVTGDLSSIGGSATQAFFDDGATGGDTTAGDSVFTHTATVSLAATPGVKSLPVTVADAELRTSNTNIGLTVTFAGTPAINVTPTSRAFGNVLVGSTSAPLSVTITNTGTADLVLGNLTLATGTQFSISTDPSGQTIPVSGQVTASIVFAPTSTGAKSDTLTIPSNASTTPTVSLTGTGVSPVISVVPTTIPFGNQPVSTTSGSQNVTISNTGSANLSIGTVTLTGANAGDFTILNNPSAATITPGNNAQFQVRFTPSAAGARAATITIPNNDPANPSPTVSLSGTGILPGVLQFSSATYSATESGGSVVMSVTRTGGTDGAVSGQVTFANATAIGGAACSAGVDYINTAIPVNFANGDSAPKAVNVPICDESLDEPSETFTASLGSPTGGATIGSPSAATNTITDDDAAPTISINDVSQAEGNAGSTNMTFTVSLSAASGFPVSVNYATANATATTADGDYTATSGTLFIPAGSVTSTVSVSISGDTKFEANETFNVNLSGGSNYDAAGSDLSGVGTINNDDSAPTIAISDVTKAEGNVGTTVFSFTITQSAVSGSVTMVNVATENGTATAGSDYAAGSGTMTIPAGSTSVSFAIFVIGDTAVESDETFAVNLSGGSGYTAAGSDLTGLGTIQNDDTSVQFAQALYSVSEGVGTVTISVTRVGSSTGAIGINYAFAGITANGAASCGAGIDFAAVSGTLSWANGDTAPKTFNVTICDDALTEGTESFVSQLQSPTGGATIGSQSSTQVDIIDNDGDSTAPVIFYTPISNDPVTTSLTATITDAVGVTDASIFWSINAGSFTSAPCTLSGGTSQNGTWSCVISGASSPSAVAYYVTASDAAANTGANPSGGASAPNLFTIGSATVPAGTFTNMNLGNGVSLGGNVFVNGNLTLNGVVNAGANTLTLGCNAAIIGGGEFSYVVGNIEKQFCGTGTFTFHVGAAFALPPVRPETTELSPEGSASSYSPLTVNIMAGTVGSSLTVNAVDAFMAGVVQVNSISRFWNVTENGNLTANLSATYRNEDVVGDENSYSVLRRSGSFTAIYPGGTVNAATNTFTAPGVADFSSWTAGTAAPTAAHSSLTGRVADASGYALSNVTVTIEGGGLTAPLTTRTNTFGNYSFDGLPAGYVYFVTVSSRRYVFGDPMQVVAVNDNVAGVDFIASATQ